MPEDQQSGSGVDFKIQESFKAFDLPEIAGIRIKTLLSNQSSESDVWLGERDDGKEVAVKIYRHGRIPGLMDDQKKRSLQHPNLLPVLQTGEVSARYFEVLPYVSGPTLAQFLQKKQILSEPEANALVRQLAQAIHYLHAEHVLHRDIKPSNVFVTKSDPLELMLADFGTARLTAQQTMLTSSCGTVAYSSPEALTGLQSEASDYWSLGIILMEALTGRQPFAGIDLKQQLYRVVSGQIEIPEGVSPRWEELLRGLLRTDYTQRWRKKEIDAWLRADVSTIVAPVYPRRSTPPRSTPPAAKALVHLGSPRLERIPEQETLTMDDFIQIFVQNFKNYFWGYFWILFIFPTITRNTPIGWDLLLAVLFLAIASRYTPTQLERYKRRKRVEWQLRGYSKQEREEIEAAAQSLFGRDHGDDHRKSHRGSRRRARWVRRIR
jgi:serine/threonine protein kinase